MNIGKRLKAYREYHQLTQEDLATKAGVNEKYYGRIERNESCPTVDKLEKICTASVSYTHLTLPTILLV